MRARGLLTLMLLGALVVFTLGSCASGPKVRAPERPAWVDQGAGAYPGDQGECWYGVGIAAKSINPAMRRTKADHRARVDISRAVSSYVTGMIKDFMVDYPDYFHPELAGSEEFTSSVSKEITEATLRGAEIVDHWAAPDGTFYALARMPKKGVDDGLVDALRSRKGALLEAKTDMALKELEEELKKKDIRQQQMMKERLGQ